MKLLTPLLLSFWLFTLGSEGAPLDENQVTSLLNAGFSSQEVIAEVRKLGYAGGKEVAVLKRLREAGADAELVLLLTQQTAPATTPPATVEVEYTVLQPFKGDNGKFGYMDLHDKVVLPPKWDEAGAFYSFGRARVKLGAKSGYINPAGEVAVPLEWDDVDDFFCEGLAAVEKGGRWGFVDLHGAVAIPPRWNSVDRFSEGMAAVGENGQCGYIDKSGKLVIPLTWSLAHGFHEGLADVMDVVKLNGDKAAVGKHGMIDQTGKAVIPVKWHYLKVSDHGSGDEIHCGNFTTEGVLFMWTAIESASKNPDAEKPELKLTDVTLELLAEVRTLKEKDWDEFVTTILGNALLFADNAGGVQAMAREAKARNISLFTEQATYIKSGPGRVTLKK